MEISPFIDTDIRVTVSIVSDNSDFSRALLIGDVHAVHCLLSVLAVVELMVVSIVFHILIIQARTSFCCVVAAYFAFEFCVERVHTHFAT